MTSRELTSDSPEAAETRTPAPHLISYAMTRECNLSCKHCYSDADRQPDPDELSTQEAKELLNQMAEWGIRLLILDGGEPLCREDVFELAGHASSLGLRAVLGTNGTLLDAQAVKNLKSCGVMAVQISIDGADAATHDSFRGQQGTFERALAAASFCKAGGLPFQFGLTIRRTVLEQIPDMLRLTVEAGANAAEFFDLVQVPRVKREIPDEVLSPAERRDVMTWLAEAQQDCPIIIRVPACPMYPLLLQEKQIKPRHFPADLLRRVPYYGRGCAAGMPNGYLTVLPNGDLIPCMLLQVKLGNVRQESITTLWDSSEVLAALRDRSLLKGECGRCAHRDMCAGCRGRAYEETGDMLAADPGCWRPSKTA